jgi:hypothetical protein
MPTTVLIAPGGAVVAQHMGELRAGDLGRLLAQLEGR